MNTYDIDVKHLRSLIEVRKIQNNKISVESNFLYT